MLPKYHILYGFIFAAILFNFISLIPSLIVFLAAVFIDIDHYLVYVLIKKDFHIGKAFNYFYFMAEKTKGKRIKHPICVLHTIEVLLIVAALSFFSRIIFFVLLGFLFHSFLDIVWMIYNKKLYAREFSLIAYFKNRNKNGYMYW